MIYDLAKFETQMSTSRSNFLLFFQSMLFGAVASLAGRETFIPIWLLMVLGVLTSILTGYLNWVTYLIEDYAMEKLKETDIRFERMFDEIAFKNKIYRSKMITNTMIYVFPGSTAIVWVIMLFLYINHLN